MGGGIGRAMVLEGWRYWEGSSIRRGSIEGDDCMSRFLLNFEKLYYTDNTQSYVKKY